MVKNHYAHEPNVIDRIHPFFVGVTIVDMALTHSVIDIVLFNISLTNIFLAMSFPARFHQNYQIDFGRCEYIYT